MMKHDLRKISSLFQIEGHYAGAEVYGKGHINDTYAVTFKHDGVPRRYVIQHVNQNVFKNSAALMDNVARVTEHQHRKLKQAGCKDPERRALTLIPTRDGATSCLDESGNPWRTYLFIEGAASYDMVKTPRQAYEAAKAFGEFQKALVDLPGPRLFETIPDFHNTPKRFEVLEAAIDADTQNRAKDANKEIEYAMQNQSIVGFLLEQQSAGMIPERITHNDTKMNNVLLDEKTNEGLCIIDLDTVMPGLALYDFGDMVRSATNTAPEDERELSKVRSDNKVFEQLVNGYLESTHDFLTKAERDNLAFSGRLISFEIGVRFLTDYLSGDVYFKTHRQGQNLDRCRTQFKLSQSIAEQESDMATYVEEWSAQV